MRILCLSLPLCLIFIAFSQQNHDDDLYQLLGVGRDASVKEIRKAFKVLAVKLHPDKNKEDVEADVKFVKIARAYEILKDPDKRKKYDLYGETGDAASTPKQKYHSYTYYRDEFGIYDDDPLIITLSKADYEVNVLDRNQAWFVNFYSPHCHHCHELAPTWRQLAAELEGVVRIAAVNCEDDWSLCYQLGIQSYPSLLYYEREAHLYEGEKYTGARTLDVLKEFVLSRVPVRVKQIGRDEWAQSGLRGQNWLLFLCPMENGCPEAETQLKLAASLEGLMGVGLITDANLCETIYKNYKNNPVVLWKVDENEIDPTSDKEIHVIQGSDTKEILNSVLSFLPNPIELDESDFRDVRRKLEDGADNPWLLCFYLGAATELSLQLKRLPALLPGFNIGLIKCSKSAALCSALHISHYPTWGIIKLGGAFEIHHGRDVLYEVTAFARDSSAATNLHALSPADFYNLKQEGQTWFVDWYAPWCPPCRKLMPELRRASQHFDGEKIKFGTIDCTLHRNLCSQQGIRSYPTTMLYNGSQINYFHGVPNEAGIVEFIQDLLNPTVIALNEHNFVQLTRKPATELWIVDYFAPWCAPCQRLAPEWRNLAKQMVEFDVVKVAQVDCVANPDLCTAQNVHGYPTIRLYPLGAKGLSTVALYNGHRDALSLKRWILNFLPSPVEQLTSTEFRKQILTKSYHLPWLVEFYAPWCGHCTHFEPIYRQVAERLEGKVRCGKVDCEAERDFCREMRIGAYPTVVFYSAPNERHEISTQMPAEILEQVRGLMERRKRALYGHDEL